ncbi:hypothetical protein AHAS_Ahas19G0205300 [Arachis hypogaea]
MRVVAPPKVKSFAELVNMSRVVEDCFRKNMNASTSHNGYHNRGGGARSITPRGRNFKRGGYAQKPQRGRATFRGNNNNNHQGRRYGWQPHNDFTCMRCGSYHPNTPCRTGLGLCYIYGGAGHMS